MLEQLKKLIDVKSIMTLTCSGVFCYLSAVGKLEAEQFLTIFTMVCSFYFGVQMERHNTNNSNEGEAQASSFLFFFTKPICGFYTMGNPTEKSENYEHNIQS